MVVLVQPTDFSVEPKRLEALRRAISRRNGQIEVVTLSSSEVERQKRNNEVASRFDALQVSYSSVPTEHLNLVKVDMESLSTPVTEKHFSIGASEGCVAQRNPTRVRFEIDHSQSKLDRIAVEELQKEEEIIIKRIEKLNEDKHELFLKFKRMISKQNDESKEGTTEEFQYNAESIGIKPRDLTGNDEKKVRETLQIRGDSFDTPGPAYRRRRGTINAPFGYINTNNSYLDSSRTTASTRGSYHNLGRGRPFVSQYLDQGRGGYYNEHNFRMGSGYIPHPMIYSRSLMHIPQTQRGNTNHPSRFGLNFAQYGMIRHNSR